MTITPSMRNLVDYNERRAVEAAARKFIQVQQAIRILEHVIPPPNEKRMHSRYLEVLQLRLRYQDKTLAELGALHHMTKHAYSGRLRRALAYADEWARI